MELTACNSLEQKLQSFGTCREGKGDLLEVLEGSRYYTDDSSPHLPSIPTAPWIKSMLLANASECSCDYDCGHFELMPPLGTANPIMNGTHTTS